MQSPFPFESMLLFGFLSALDHLSRSDAFTQPFENDGISRFQAQVETVQPSFSRGDQDIHFVPEDGFGPGIGGYPLHLRECFPNKRDDLWQVLVDEVVAVSEEDGFDFPVDCPC